MSDTTEVTSRCCGRSPCPHFTVCPFPASPPLEADGPTGSTVDAPLGEQSSASLAEIDALVETLATTASYLRSACIGITDDIARAEALAIARAAKTQVDGWKAKQK